MPMEDSTLRRHTSALASIPTMHSSRSVRMALRRSLIDSKDTWPMTGSMTLSWSWPASAAKVSVTSLPITLKQTWLTTSGMIGLTLAGMIEEPAARSGRRISPRPARGPEDSSLRSLQILESLTARRLMAACIDT